MARFLLFIAVLAISTAAPLIQFAAPAPALTVAATRVGLAGLLLWLAAPSALTLLARLSRREQGLLVAAGLLLSAHFGVWISSMYLTSTAASVALVATNPIFAALFARTLGDAIRRQEVVGMAVAGLGCVVLGGGDVVSGSLDAALGDVLAVLGAVTAAGYLLLGRRLRACMPLTPYLAVVNLVAGASLIAAAVIAGAPFAGFDTRVYAAMAMGAIIPSIIGHSLLNWSVRRNPTHLVALAILGEPMGASFLTWVAFDEIPPVHALIGGLVILLGIGIGFRGRNS